MKTFTIATKKCMMMIILLQKIKMLKCYTNNNNYHIFSAITTQKLIFLSSPQYEYDMINW